MFKEESTVKQMALEKLFIGLTSSLLSPYHGLGSGIKRALAEWPEIDFSDDRDGCLFTVTVQRKPVEQLQLAGSPQNDSLKSNKASGKRRESVGKASGKRRESVGKASGKILAAIRESPAITIPELAALIGITERSVQRNIQKLQQEALLRRQGGRKEGYWEVLE